MAGSSFCGAHATASIVAVSLFRRIVCILSAIGVLLPGLVYAQTQMATPGTVSVSPSGGANYSIPIQVPPGTAGMQPSVALAYNSQRGNGLAGVGWSISTGSTIHRCGKTFVQDGALVGVNYSTNDRLCLDGNRLVLVAGAYGFAGS